jgi:hypothetical protein
LAASLPGRAVIEALPLAERLLGLAERWWLASQAPEAGAELLKRHRDRVLRATIGELLDLLLAWFRDLVALHSGALPEAVVNRDHQEQLAQALGGYPLPAAQAAGRQLRDLKRYIQQGNANLRLAAEVLMIGLIEVTTAPHAIGATA